MKKGVNLTLILLIIGVIILISVIVGKNTSTKKSENQNKNEVEENVIDNEFYEELEDGTKINTSAKLKESKKIEGLELTDIQLTENNNTTLLLGKITNISDENQGGYPVKVKVTDKEGNEIIVIDAYIGELKPGESEQFSTSATFNYINAYNFELTK